MQAKPYTIIIDTREQSPWQFPPDVATTTGTLASGDYSLIGLEHLVAVERKSLQDLIACVGPERDRFCRELHRLQAYRVAAVVVEASMADVLNGAYRSKTTPTAVLGSVASWQQRYRLPFVFAGNAQAGSAYAMALFDGLWRDLHRLVHSLGLTGGAQSPANVASKRPRPDTGRDRQDAAGGNARPRSGKF